MQIVIIFSATYPALDPDLPACFSRRIRGELRERSGSGGVSINDALEDLGPENFGPRSSSAGWWPPG